MYVILVPSLIPLLSSFSEKILPGLGPVRRGLEVEGRDGEMDPNPFAYIVYVSIILCRHINVYHLVRCSVRYHVEYS